MSKESDLELAGVAARAKADGNKHTAMVVEQSVRDIENLKLTIVKGYDIMDKELLPNIATMAIQDFGRLNDFMIIAGRVKREIESD